MFKAGDLIIFKVGDRVQHKTTGITGTIIGYGYRKINDSYYLTTLKVELMSYLPISPIAEDLFDKWQVWQKRKILAFSPTRSSNRYLSQID